MKTKDTETQKKYNPEITKEDKELLGDKSGNLRHDGGADQMLENRDRPADFAGKDLDISSRVNSETNSPKPVKDEENKHYSTGGDRHNDLEERQRS